MACYHPRHMMHVDFSNIILWRRYLEYGWKINKDTMQGYKILCKDSREIDVEKALDEFRKQGTYAEIIEVPCGNCVGCRLDYSKDWANRCALEASYYEKNYFVTLTYDDEYVPISDSTKNLSLLKDDFSKFIHALRDKFRNDLNFTGIKYFGCGEYGDQTFRPHYHMILFNCPIPDLTCDFPGAIPGSIIRKKDKRGCPMFYSKFLSSCWNKGIITIQEATWNMEAYVSKYVLKKQKGLDAIIYEKLDVVPPFVRMSQGIGLKHFNDHVDDIKKNPVLIVGREHKAPMVSGIPRYYKKKLKISDPQFYEQLTDKARQRSEDSFSKLRNHQKINDNRANRESEQLSHNIFIRDF